MELSNYDIETLDWNYFAEGNANIILKNIEYKLALRLRKTATNQPKDESFCRKVATLISLEEEEAYFYEIIFNYFKGNERYLNKPTLVSLSESFVKFLASLIEGKRPGKRKSKQLEIRCQAAVVMPFLGYFDCNILSKENKNFISVEIKPKWGFLPFSKFISVQNSFKKSICRFCLHQHLKVKKGTVKDFSQYCPLDLFGDCKCKIIMALESLLRTPQNNIKTMMNGILIESSELEKFHIHHNICEILSEIFVEDSRELVGINTKTFSKELCLYSKFKRHSNDCVELGPGGIINLLKTLQCLDNYDIEYIGLKFKDILKESEFNEEDFLDYRSKLWSSFLASHTGRSQVETANLGVFDLCNYLISSTFKDCSIMVTFCEVSCYGIQPNFHRIVQLMGHFYKYEIKLVDLDPRHLQNLPYYYELDQEIVSTYMETLSKRIH